MSVVAVPVIFSAVRNWPGEKSNLFIEGGVGFVAGSLTWSWGEISQTGSGTSGCLSMGGGGEFKIGANSYLGANLRAIIANISELNVTSSSVAADINKPWLYKEKSVDKKLPLELSGGALNFYIRFLF